jgi:hypothetical protein
MVLRGGFGQGSRYVVCRDCYLLIGFTLAGAQQPRATTAQEPRATRLPLTGFPVLPPYRALCYISRVRFCR